MCEKGMSTDKKIKVAGSFLSSTFGTGIITQIIIPGVFLPLVPVLRCGEHKKFFCGALQNSQPAVGLRQGQWELQTHFWSMPTSISTFKRIQLTESD